MILWYSKQCMFSLHFRRWASETLSDGDRGVAFVIHNMPLSTQLEFILMRRLLEDGGWLPEEPIMALKGWDFHISGLSHTPYRMANKVCLVWQLLGIEPITNAIRWSTTTTGWSLHENPNGSRVGEHTGPQSMEHLGRTRVPQSPLVTGAGSLHLPLGSSFTRQN